MYSSTERSPWFIHVPHACICVAKRESTLILENTRLSFSTFLAATMDAVTIAGYARKYRGHIDFQQFHYARVPLCIRACVHALTRKWIILCHSRNGLSTILQSSIRCCGLRVTFLVILLNGNSVARISNAKLWQNLVIAGTNLQFSFSFTS